VIDTLCVCALNHRYIDIAAYVQHVYTLPTCVLFLYLPHIVRNHDKTYVMALTHTMDITNVIGNSDRRVRQSGIVAHNVKLTGEQNVRQTISNILIPDGFDGGKQAA